MNLNNIHLDHLGRAKNNSSIYNTSSSLARTILDATEEISQKNLIFISNQQEFLDWIWVTIQRLQLYCEKQSLNAYALAGSAVHSEPFESLDSSNLIILRSYMKTDPLAAYSILLLSEIGHRFDMLNEYAIPLLKVLAKSYQSGAFFRASFQIFKAYAAIKENKADMTLDSITSLFEMVWTGITKKSLDSTILYLEFTLNDTSSTSIAAYTYIDYSLSYWTTFIYSNPNWFSNSNSLSLFDVIARYSYEHGHQSKLMELLAIKYHKMVVNYQPPVTDVKFSLAAPIQSMLEIAAGTISSIIGLAFPTLFAAMDIPFPPYYVFTAMCVETVAEKDIRLSLGQIITKENLTLDSVQYRIRKPLKSFLIYKWAQLLLKMPASEGLLPLYWQAFFSLYFERFDTHGGFETCFGYKFLASQPATITSLKEKLSELAYSLRLQPFLLSLYNAFGLWLQDETLLHSEPNVNLLTSSYLPARLHTCLYLDVFFVTDLWWYDLVVDSYKELPLSYQNTICEVEKSKNIMVFEPFAPILALSLREPQISVSRNLTISEALQILNVDVKNLVNTSNDFTKISQQLIALDKSFLADISRLYMNVTKRATVIKKCGPKSADVVLEYEYQERLLDTEVLDVIQANRTLCESYFDRSSIETSICVSALKLSRMKLFFGNLQDTEANSKLFMTEFYKLLDVLDNGLEGFSPSECAIRDLAQVIGSKFIAFKSKEVDNVFLKLKGHQNTQIFSTLFHPSLITDKFVEYYRELSKNIVGYDSAAVFASFKIKEWINNLSPPGSDMLEDFLKAILDSCSRTVDDECTFNVHAKLLADFIVLNPCGIEKLALKLIIRGALDGKYPDRMIQYHLD